MTPEAVVALGRAAGRVLGADIRFLIARDTRRSGPLLEAALVAGLSAEGVTVELAGVLPTPGLAYLSQVASAPAAMISASHNPFADNGVKLFGRGGRKLDEAVEARIESVFDDIVDRGPGVVGRSGLAGSDVGEVREFPGALEAYTDHLVGALDGRTLDGTHVVVDCGNGAASVAAPAALARLGARTTVLHAHPDGVNINEGCGSTHPADLRKAVVAEGADIGLAFDGDADRVIAVDERGALVDGDHVLAIAAIDLLEHGRLRGDAVVGTVMANFGLRRALAVRGIRFVETPVGDRAVLDAMQREDLALGGEQSGHVIFADLATTGDGTLTGIVLLDVLARTGRALSELASVVSKWPQVLRNVRVARREALPDAERFWSEVRDVEDELRGTGRVLVRASGTEPVVRVMVEAEAEAAATELAERLTVALTAALGAG